MSRTVLVARHAATGNAERHVISGTLDEPLSDLGRAQARDYVAEHGLVAADAIISSPLSRALETAEILSGTPRGAIETWPALVERSYGVLQGLPADEVATYRSRIRYIRAGGIDHSYDPPGGETLDELRVRAERVAADILARPEERILVVSHQVLLQQLIGALLCLPLIDALAIDIRVLQIDEVTLEGILPAARRTVHPGAPALASW